MKYRVLTPTGFLIALVVAVRSISPASFSEAMAYAAPEVTIPLYSGMGTVNFLVTTNSARAKKYFEQGMAFAYGFNHDEAERSFARAARFDPGMPMAYWGIALVLGPNYNLPGDEERGTRAYKAIRQAQALKGKVTAKERDLIAALGHRYGDDGKETPELDQAYANAMREVAHRYPDDADVQVLFAESLMDLHPWMLWTVDGKPKFETVEIVSTLEAVLRKYPNHLGANHYYIHAVEASSDPSRATPSADRLGSLAPKSGHLVHMPAHIYIRTGRYHASAVANENAIKVDEALLAQTKEGGVYPIMYYAHNIHFLCYSQLMEGRSRDALASARKLNARITVDAVREMPMAEFLLPTTMLVETRFGNWDAIMQEKSPPDDLPYADIVWHYSRGLAFIATDKLDDAELEQQALHKIAMAIPPDRPLGTSNSARQVSEAVDAVLAGRIASAKGDHKGAIRRLSEAVKMQDGFVYDEPPIWFFPIRETLGAELLADGQAASAEAVYREDLKLNPGNPRSLSGLAKSLRAQGKKAEAAKVDRQFKEAWRYADVSAG